jgi:hypothetical protein
MCIYFIEHNESIFHENVKCEANSNGSRVGVEARGTCSRSQQEGRYKIRLPMRTLSMDGWGRSESGPTASLWQRGEERRGGNNEEIEEAGSARIGPAELSCNCYIMEGSCYRIA